MPPADIMLMRHGEKPVAHGVAPFGVTADGVQCVHSLTPRGWQRAGALIALFLVKNGRPSELPMPTNLVAPDYGDATFKHRSYQTLLPLSVRLATPIQIPADVGSEEKAARKLLAMSGSVLVCWEHGRLSRIAEQLPLKSSDQLPDSWDDDRFDLLWWFSLSHSTDEYSFTLVHQELLSGDTLAHSAGA